eukprot:CAMPEP_0202727818 /NCGR_PEP_ID=MMETSP1385-20130828/185314_1 /ASSEMBLY_ACC=CAM_ASM_000861 /TAXON_ID=933848 /ORGANISM="Elphidium margaritaceum" /LENGTH=330 /DNA_ID=CAMNT_0049394061 /DNA_START=50 /DNA_END=1042 /DNA_ORIENTATION=+
MSDNKTRSVLDKIGLIAPIKIATSLQGSIWRGKSSPLPDEKENEQEAVVVKVSNKRLAEHRLGKVGDITVAVQEDVVKEAALLSHLTQDDECPTSIVKFQRLLHTNVNYYLVMEDGGLPLFEFVVKCHELIRTKVLPVAHWKSVVRIIFSQMLECVQYMHAKNVCHFDISLENFCINDVQVKLVEQADGSEVVHFVTDDIHVKLCDFGLSEKFEEGKKSISNKFVGKTGYKSPEVAQKKKNFDAKANDIWCLGVTLFMMLAGTPPWLVADASDDLFVRVVEGQMAAVLKAWHIYDLVGDAALDLLQRIFVNEERRIGLDGIAKHAWTTQF